RQAEVGERIWQQDGHFLDQAAGPDGATGVQVEPGFSHLPPADVTEDRAPRDFAGGKLQGSSQGIFHPHPPVDHRPRSPSWDRPAHTREVGSRDLGTVKRGSVRQRPLDGKVARLLGTIIVNHILDDAGGEVTEWHRDWPILRLEVPINAAVLLEIDWPLSRRGGRSLAPEGLQRTVQVSHRNTSADRSPEREKRRRVRNGQVGERLEQCPVAEQRLGPSGVQYVLQSVQLAGWG